MCIFILLTFLAFSLFLTILFYKRRIKRMRFLENCGIPGPEPNLFTGNLSEYNLFKNVKFDSYMTQRYGKISGYYLGAKPFILISDIDLIKKIENENSKVFLSRPRRIPGGINPDKKRTLMLGNLDEEKWREMRKVLSPAFTPNKLKQMFPQINGLVKTFKGKVSKYAENPKNEINFYSFFQGLALDIIGKIAFGINSNIQENINDSLHLAVQAEFGKSTNTFLIKLYLCFPEISKLIQPIRIFIQNCKNYFGQTESSPLWEKGFEVLKARIQMSPEEKERVDLLQLLLNKNRTENEIVANSVLFFEAGYETLSATLAFCIHLLVKYPEIQDQLRDEILQILGDEENEDFYGAIKNLEYLEAVIYETIRLFPAQTTFIGRSPNRDFEYEDQNGRKIILKKGVHIQIALFQIHHSEENWENPEEFKPERFLRAEGKKLKRETIFQGFGQGPRHCIGQSFAMLAMKLILASLLKDFKLVASEHSETDIKIRYKVATMTPFNGTFAKAIPI